jgi:hypothetical protein
VFSVNNCIEGDLTNFLPPACGCSEIVAGVRMIISASRRTDIPAFYGKWFYNRIRAGYLETRNPHNSRQIKTIDLSPDKIDCLVFWTKDPLPFMKGLSLIKNYSYYFLFTLNAYPTSIERFLKPTADLLGTFRQLSELLGPERVIWRYDPILFCRGIDLDFHLKNFSFLAVKLSGYTTKCIFSFLDHYKKTVRQMRKFGLTEPEISVKRELLKKLREIASINKIVMTACAEPEDYSDLEIGKASCIDPALIEILGGRSLKKAPDPYQRQYCGCCCSVDIGAYNSCKHGCLYCYANNDVQKSWDYYRKHDPEAVYL